LLSMILNQRAESVVSSDTVRLDAVLGSLVGCGVPQGELNI
jgi:hypothetical protein